MKPTLIFLLLLIAGTACSQALSSKKRYYGNEYWYPYYENGKTGWVSLTGNGHIAPSSITRVDYPLVSASNRNIGLIDTNGKLLIDTIYSSLRTLGGEYGDDYDPVSDTLFIFNSGSESSGIVSSTGRKIALPGYNVKSAINDLVVFGSGSNPEEWPQPPRDHRIYSIRKGAWLPYIFETIGYTRYAPIVATVKDESGGNSPPVSFLIDSEGEVIQKMPYESEDVWIWPYQNNYEDNLIQNEVPLIMLVTPEIAYVYHRDKLIDSINVVNEPKEINYRSYFISFPAKSRFPVKEPVNILMDYNSYAQIETGNGVTSYDLETGDTLWHSADTKLFFSDYETISAVTSEGKFGMCDDWKRPIFPLIFDSVIRMEGSYYKPVYTSWSEGKKVVFKTTCTIAVKDPVSGKFALADSSLRVVTPYEYDTIFWKHLFDSYKTIVVKNGLQGIADEHCNIIIPVEYDTITAYQPSDQYENGVLKFILKKGNETAVADPDGKVIWKGNYPVVNVISATEPVLIGYGETDKRGVMTADGTIVLKPAYQKIEYGSGNFVVHTATGAGIRSMTDKQVLEPEFLSIQSIRGTTAFYMVFDQQGMRIYNAAKKKFIGSWFNGPDMAVSLTGKDTFTVYSDFYSEISSGYLHTFNHAVIDANGTPVLPLHNSRIGNTFRLYSDNGFYLTDINGNKLTGKYDEILPREEMFSIEGEDLPRSCKSRYFVLTRQDTLVIFDALTNTTLEKANVSLFLSACDTDSASGVLLLQDKDGIEIYSSDLTKLSPLKFDRYDQDATGLKYSCNDYFMKLPVFYLYQGNMRYMFDRRTLTLSGPVNTENDMYDIDGRLVVEDYDKLEKIGYVLKVRKGSQLYWFTEDRFLFHISE